MQRSGGLSIAANRAVAGKRAKKSATETVALKKF